jgi:ubiquinone/menaquinone biosynthesis C-methylase UbiE
MSLKNFLWWITPPFIWEGAHIAKMALGPKGAAPGTGAHSEQWWKTRDEGKRSSDEDYWAHRTHASRTKIAEVVSLLDGNSLLEVGCHIGPTLWAIAQKKQFDRLAGTELSPSILEKAKARLPEALGRPVDLLEASASALPFPDKSFDIVVTGAVLVCIGPEDILQSLAEIVRVAKRYLVLCEPFSDDIKLANADGKIDPYPNTTYWIRNYAKMLQKDARIISWDRFSEGERAGHLDSVLVLELRDSPNESSNSL